MSFGKKALSVLKKLAPTVATAVGGPFGGMAAAVLGQALGVNEDQVEEAILSGNPEVLMKVKESDQTFKVKMRELGIREGELHQRDRASAREMAAKLGMWPQVILSVIYTAGYFWMLYLLISGDWQPPANSEELVAGLVGVLTAGTIKIMDFWFGSSVGSKQKTQVMAAQEH